MAKEIIGRTDEQQRLLKALNSNEAEFIAVYGRRRVGKTFLIRNFFEDKPYHFFQASGIHYAPLQTQLQEFKKEIEKCFYKTEIGLKDPANWMEAFEMLATAIQVFGQDRKVVIFMDEFPWMATPNSGLLQALDYYWNRFWVNKPNIKLIICGSAASWIIKNILNNRGGLYNRTTLRLELQPFTLCETKTYLKHLKVSLSNPQILTLYMCIGGIPYYLRGLQRGLSAVQNINQLCFARNSLLLGEFKELFTSLFEAGREHEDIIRFIASKRNGVERKEIEAKVGYKGGTLTNRLKELEAAGFIYAFVPWGQVRGIYYKVIDEYTLFYLHWIEPETKNKPEKVITPKYWDMVSQTPAWKAWAGYAFEAVCYKHLSNIREALKIPDGSTAGPWKYIPPKKSAEEGVQIDMLFDRPDGNINICEIKYTKEPFVLDKSDAKELLRKEEVCKKVTKTTKHVFLSMIVAPYLKQNMYAEDVVSSQVCLDDLFKA